MHAHAVAIANRMAIVQFTLIHVKGSHSYW